MEKLEKGHELSQSPDFVAQNIELLKSLFPQLNKEGKIDKQELLALLGDYTETDEEFYRFTWAGKSMARREANKPSTATLLPDKESSKEWDTTQNVFIEGDNLEVLKLLQKGYANKIKMIYIDPPYNTGKDFVYKDNYSDNLNNYLAITGQLGEDGKRISTNSESNGRYHSNWLNMMYPRLKLARNLLKEDGVIFISIDEKEFSNLQKLVSELFGEENYLGEIVWETATDNNASQVSMEHEYILCYSKLKTQQDKWQIKSNKADFIIQVDSNFISPRLPVPPVVVLAELDENNKIVKTSTFEPVLVPINANSPNAGQGSLFLTTTKTYAFNVTSYLQKLASEGKKSVRLALVPGGYISTSSTQSIINHSNLRRAAIKSAKLNVFYTYAK